MIVRQSKVCDVGEFSELWRQTNQFILRHIQLSQLLQLSYLLYITTASITITSIFIIIYENLYLPSKHGR